MEIKECYMPLYDNFKIYKWMTEMGLSTSELLVYAFIYDKTKDGNGYKITQDNLARMLGYCRLTVNTAIRRLSDKKLVYRHRGVYVVNHKMVKSA